MSETKKFKIKELYVEGKDCPNCYYPELVVVEQDRTIQRLGDGCRLRCPWCQFEFEGMVKLRNEVNK